MDKAGMPPLDPAAGQSPADANSGNQMNSRLRTGLILIGLQLAAAIVTLIIRIIKTTHESSGLAGASLGIAAVITVIDLIWMIFLLDQKRKLVNGFSNVTEKINSAQSISGQSTTKTAVLTLTRVQAIVAWLIYHTAAIPFLLLVERVNEISLLSFALVHGALLVMGLIPILTMIWLDRFLSNAIRR